MVSFISNPRVSLDIVPRDQRVGLEDYRVLICGQKLSGSAAAGLNRDLPRTNAEINALYGARSHLAMMLRNFRAINPVSAVDVIALADNGSGTAGTASIAWSGTATAATKIYVSVVSATNHRYEIDVEVGDTAAALATKIDDIIDLDLVSPFTAATSTGTITFTAANKGTLCNSWLVSVLDAYDRPAVVPGLTYTITGWASGATNPSLSGVFDAVESIRYQAVVWPSSWTLATGADWIDARKNVDNNLMDGTLYAWVADSFANVKTAASNTNSSEVVLLTNEPNDLAYWKGPHVPEAGDVIAAKFAAAVALRFEDGWSVSDIVVTNEPNDQFGGMDKASLPYFNTPLIGLKRPINGTGYIFEEQVELEDAGVTVVGYNRPNNAVIMGQVVTTWLNDDAGNADDTWKYLEWRHTHGAIREYMVLNCRKEFAQHRLTRGIAVPGYAIASEASIRAFLYQLYDELADKALTVKGREYRKLFEDRLVVTLKPELRRVEIAADVPMVSQLGEIIGSVKFNWDTAA